MARIRTEGEELDGWRADIFNQLTEPRIEVRAYTFQSAYDLIRIAAYNRRMHTQEFLGRAGLAIAVFDSAGEHSWREMTLNEPPMRDVRRHNMPLKRKFGGDFGPWVIKEME